MIGNTLNASYDFLDNTYDRVSKPIGLQQVFPTEQNLRITYPENLISPKIEEVELEQDYNPIIESNPIIQNISQTNEKTIGEKIADTAKQFEGLLYKWGGTDPSGFDCSGLIQYAYKQNGINIPRVSHDQGKSGRAVSRKDVQAGDIIYSKSRRSPSGGHVRLAIDNNRYIEAPGRGKGIRFGNIDNLKNVESYRRIVSAKQGSKIHIKKENKGKFTEYCNGKVTNECIQKGKNSSDPKIRKRATFAQNARRWNNK